MAKNTTPTRPTPPKAAGPTVKIDLSLISDERKAELLAKAKLKIQAEQLLLAEEAFLADAEKAEREIANPQVQDEMRSIRVDLPLFADRITLDGRIYFHGEHYDVPKRVYDVLKECETRAARHDDEIWQGNENDSFYRRERNDRLNWKTGAAMSGSAPIRF